AGETGNFEVECRVRHKDGSYRWQLSRGVAVRDAGGKPTRFVGSGVDITDRKRTEEALRASEERFRTLAKATNDAVGDWDLATNKTGCKEGFLTLFGYRLDSSETTPEWWLGHVHPEDREEVEESIFAVIRGAESIWADEYRFRCADGSYKDVYDRGHVLRDADGQATRMIGAMLDITSRKRAEEEIGRLNQELRSRLDEMQAILDVVPIGIGIAHDPKCRRITHNPYLSEVTGVPLGKNASFDAPPNERPTNHRAYQDGKELQPEQLPMQLACAGVEVRDFEMDIVRTDGGPTCKLLCYVRPLKDAEGRVRGSVGGFLDITARRKAEEELRRAKEAAEAANRAKDEFLANVSHEIRTPMNAILGMTELILDTPLADDQRQCLRTVKSAADNLLGVINDLLDFAKIEAGRLELDPAEFSLSSALGATLRALAVRAHKKGLELVCQQRPGVPDALIGDAGRLRQVLLNLVGNAIKFTERGEVVVLVENAAEPAPEGEVHLRFAVTDTGIGIPPEKQAKIFRAFEQEDTSTTRKYGGTGLGLTIAARLVALIGGQITVKS